MNTETLQNHAEKLWETYIEIFPALVRFDCPRVEFNNRLSSCAGCAYTYENHVELSTKFYLKFSDRIIGETLPHELGHQIDHNLNGWHKYKRHHGKTWTDIMVKLGVPFRAYIVNLIDSYIMLVEAMQSKNASVLRSLITHDQNLNHGESLTSHVLEFS